MFGADDFVWNNSENKLIPISVALVGGRESSAQFLSQLLPVTAPTNGVSIGEATIGDCKLYIADRLDIEDKLDEDDLIDKVIYSYAAMRFVLLLVDNVTHALSLLQSVEENLARIENTTDNFIRPAIFVLAKYEVARELIGESLKNIQFPIHFLTVIKTESKTSLQILEEVMAKVAKIQELQSYARAKLGSVMKGKSIQDGCLADAHDKLFKL